MVIPVVMHHPQRADRLSALCDALSPCGVVVDPDPHGPPSTWRTARLAWQLAWQANNSHAMVIQDDAILAPDLMGHVDMILTRGDHRDDVVSLYCPRRGVSDAYQRGEQWYREPPSAFLASLALVMPCPLALDMLGWLDTHDDLAWGRHDDTRIKAWLRATGRHVWQHVPSLVDHDDTDTIMGNRGIGNRPRRAAVTWQADWRHRGKANQG